MKQLLYLGLNNKGTTDFIFRVVATRMCNMDMWIHQKKTVKFHEEPYKSLIMKFTAI